MFSHGRRRRNNPSQVETVQVRVGQVRTCHIGTGQVKLVEVYSSQNWSSLVKTGQVILDQVKLSQDRSSQVGIGSVRQVKLEMCCAQNILHPKFVWTQNLYGPEMHVRMEFDSAVGPTCFCVGSLPLILIPVELSI